MKNVLLLAMALVSMPVSAQQNAIIPTSPHITVSSRGEVKVAPDRANIQISVQTRASTAAAAAADNATKQKAVIDALRALGLRANQISTTGYHVVPETRYEPNREPVVVGYSVTNTISVELEDLNLVGRVIDTSISRGANMISSLTFYSANTDSARHAAISQAVRKGRQDAEAAARAAGGSVGGLLEVTIGAYFPPPRPVDFGIRAAAQNAPETPITPGEQTVGIDVTTRWSFVSSR